MKIIHPSYFPTHNFTFHKQGDPKHQVCLRIRPSVYAPDNKLILSPRAPNATLPPFPTTNHPAPAINVPLYPSAQPSPNTQ